MKIQDYEKYSCYGFHWINSKIMKSYPKVFTLVFVAALIFLCSNYTAAQSNEPYIYGELGSGNGNFRIEKAAINAIFCNNNIISLNYYFTERMAPNAPADFQWGNSIMDGYSSPQSLSVYGISYGKVFFTRYHYLRFTAKGGLTEGSVSTPTDYQLHQSIMGNYYSYSFHKDYVTGIVLEPTLEWVWGSGFGLSFGLYSNLNTISSVIGFDVCMIFGKVSSRRANNKNH